MNKCLQTFCDEKGSWPCDQTLGHVKLHRSQRKINETDYEYREWNAFGKTRPPEYMGRMKLPYPTPTRDIKNAIKVTLVPDAIKTLFCDDIDISDNPVIEIRAKLTHFRKEQIPRISNRWGIAWFYAPPYTDDLEGFDTYTLAQEPLFDFDGQMPEVPLGGYLLLARLEL